jgi:AmmeMemoRadiSam system protein A
MSIPPEDRADLVRLARGAVEATVAGKPLPTPQRLSGVLGEHRGCFVTLTNRGRLRGCIGTFRPDRALAEMVIQMAAAAARDSRFLANPVVPAELSELKVEVSVLSALAKTTEPEKLQIGKHGVYVVRGGMAGCFLPEVATEMGWDAREFLSQCCAGKAGLHPDAWRQPGTDVFLFSSEKFDR